MAVVTHFQRRIPCPTVASEASGSLLTSRTIITGWALTSEIIKRIRNYIYVIRKRAKVIWITK